jgi:hypothetical protein
VVSLILLVFAFVLCMIEAFYPNWAQPRWGWLGLALYFLSLILGAAAGSGLHAGRMSGFVVSLFG